MDTHPNQNVIALLCDATGIIIKVMRNDFAILQAESDRLWIGLIDHASIVEGLNFWREITEKGEAYDWEMGIERQDQVVPLHFAGGKVNEWILIVGSSGSSPMRYYEEEMSKILNEYANLLRVQIQSRPTPDRVYLEEVSRLNSELMNIQRELTKTISELSEKQRFIQRIFETAPNVLLIYDIVEQITIFANREIVTILGYTPAEIQGMGPSFLRQLVHPTDSTVLDEHYNRFNTLPNGETIEIEYRLRDATGNWRWISSRDTIFTRDAEGKPRQILSIAQDITERKNVQEKLWYLSTHDALTGLYNRGYFHEEMTRYEKTRAFPISILIADLDNLKRTNDTFGHVAGDDLLRRAANTLRACFRPGEIIARVGGDEFAVLLEHTPASTAKAISERIQRMVMAESLAIEGPSLGMSIGAATAEAPQPLLEIYKLADSQMYSDKVNRKQTGRLVGRS
jgi:diguanylate cyclase (GGDEF)-like protein/PAS domain S-box-containing protein